MRLSEKFYKKEFSSMHLHIKYSQGFLYINPHFSMVANILCSHSFFTVRGLFWGLFVWNHTGTRKKSKKINSQNSRTLFQETFISRTVFLQDFFSAKAYFRKFFFKELFCGYLQLQTRLTADTLNFDLSKNKKRSFFISFISFELLFVHLHHF